MEPTEADRYSASRARARRRLALIAAGLLGAIFAALVWLVILAVTGRDNLPTVTAADLAAAMDRWRDKGPGSYDVEVRLSALRVETHAVEVRDGRVKSYTRNGIPMTQPRTLETWTVPGMFGTIQRDLQHIKTVAEGRADPLTPRLSVWGQFHPVYGYPDRYRRVQWGTNIEVSWEVVRLALAP